MPTKRTPYVDAHHHLWDLTAVTYPWLNERGKRRFFGDPTPIQRDYLFDEHLAMAKPLGFGKFVHIQVGADDPIAEARWVDAVAQADPENPMVQVAFCDVTDPNLETVLDELAKLKSLRGVRQIVGRAESEDSQTGTNALLEQPEFVTGLHTIAERGLSFDLQLTPNLYRKAAAVLKTVPDLSVVVCHAGSPQARDPDYMTYWATELDHLAALDSVYCKLSGLGMFDPNWTPQSCGVIIQSVLSRFGAERTMFGSNFPVDMLYSDYQALVTLYQNSIPEAAKQAVFCDTASHFYRF